ncbi:MAG: hypothetical protein KAW83_04165 [Dehalococcoidia bacterium]|nr:hypothetical protein [Dehalococcoidia bacterium]
MKRKFDFGEAIGMIVLKQWYAAVIKGHHAYASTYDFPIRIKFVEKYLINSEKGFDLPNFNLSEFIKCAKELEEEGVKAITLDCGLAGGMQEELANAVDIPVFSSNLLMVPLALRMLKKDKKVGILTDTSEYLLRDNCKVLRGCGIDIPSPRIVIKGMMQSEYRDVWVTQYLGMKREDLEKWKLKPLGKFNLQKVEEAIVSVARKMVSENPDIGAIVLECTDMPLWAKAIRKSTGLLVFDSVSLVKYIHDATVGVH